MGQINAEQAKRIEQLRGGMEAEAKSIPSARVLMKLPEFCEACMRKR